MSYKKFVVELDAGERKRQAALNSKGKAQANVILNARILLKADQTEAGEGWLDEQIAEARATNVTMVARVREKLVTEGLDAVFTRKKFEPPPGHARWTSVCWLSTLSSARSSMLRISIRLAVLKKRSQTAPDRL